ncbi:MAG TPA: GYF domain-containing protein [Pirellulales bacterium]|jgi:hypothetical protein
MSTQWWFKSLGQEFGPLSFDDLVNTARNGALVATDFVRDESSVWRPADSVEGLFQVAPKDEWLIEVIGQTLGPLSLADVAKMIRERKLMPSDRVRRDDFSEWQTIGAILKKWNAAAPGDTAERPTGPGPTTADELESLILSVLGAPSESRSKPSLVELGLAETPDIETIESARVLRHEVTVDSPNADAKNVGTRWSPMNLFRRGLPESKAGEPVAPVEAEPVIEPKATQVLLPPIERQFDAAKPDEENAANQGPRRISWLESLLLVGGIALALQLYPPAASKTLAVIDIRGWTWGNWVAAEIAIVIALSGLVFWRRG